MKYGEWLADPDVVSNLECRFIPQTQETIQAYMESIANDPNQVLFGICIPNPTVGHIHIGNIRLGPINQIHRFAEIGIMIGDKGSWNQGIATKAIGLVADYAFNVLQLHKVTAGAYGSNPASVKAFINAGFLIEGILSDQYRINNRAYVCDVLLGKWNPMDGLPHLVMATSADSQSAEERVHEALHSLYNTRYAPR